MNSIQQNGCATGGSERSPPCGVAQAVHEGLVAQCVDGPFAARGVCGTFVGGPMRVLLSAESLDVGNSRELRAVPRACPQRRRRLCHGIELRFIPPGKPIQSSHVESFYGRQSNANNDVGDSGGPVFYLDGLGVARMSLFGTALPLRVRTSQLLLVRPAGGVNELPGEADVAGSLDSISAASRARRHE